MSCALPLKDYGEPQSEFFNLRRAAEYLLTFPRSVLFSGARLYAISDTCHTSVRAQQFVGSLVYRTVPRSSSTERHVS